MRKTTPFAVEASDLSMRFGDFLAVDHISFQVRRGEIFGFLGANGAGKTTTIRMLCGLLIPTSGQICVAGLDCQANPQAIKAKVGYMSQRFTLYNDLSVSENLNFTASLRKLDESTRPKRVEQLFAFVGFNYPLKTLVKDLPLGLKQQLSLVAALLHDPEIIFLDEPTAGVSPIVRERFWKLIRQLAKTGKTIFVTTHYLDEAEHCDRIALMRTGKIIALDTPAKLKATTFPQPVIELTPRTKADQRFIQRIQNLKSVGKIEPYGLRYHLFVDDLKVWKRLAKTSPRVQLCRKIQPSLEDVFIRLVEGREK